MSYESISVFLLAVVLYGESDDDAANEELEVAQEALGGSPFDAVDVHLPVLVDVPSSVVGHTIGEEVLREQKQKDEISLTV